MDGIRIDHLARHLANATNRRRFHRELAAAGVALLSSLGAADASRARKKKKSEIKKIACREYTRNHYPACIAGATALCEEKAMWEGWDLADCLHRYVACCEFFKTCDGGERAAECQYQYVLSISPL